MNTTHTWKTISIAAGPGVVVCAVLGVIELGERHSLTANVLGAYPVTLLAFLPGIPVLAWTLVRAFPPRDASPDGRRVRPGWLVLSWCAPWWHVGAARIGLWSLGHHGNVVNWRFVLQHAACLWFVTACGWLCTSSRPQVQRMTLGLPATIAPRPVADGTEASRKQVPSIGGDLMCSTNGTPR